MSKISTFFRSTGPISVILSVVLSVLFVVTVVQAATTIGSNISTDGTVSVTGLTTMGNASSTRLSVFNNAYFGATATSSFSSTGALTLINALTYGGVALSNAVTGTGNMVLSASPTFTGLSTFGNASTTIFSSYGPSYFGATATSSFSTAGALTLATPLAVGSGGTGVTTSTGTGNVVLSASPTLTGTAVLAGATLSGLASTTQLRVGNDIVSTLSGMILGTCTLNTVIVTATSTAYTTCTGATGVTSSYTVFVQPGVPLPSGLILDAASSTATTGTLSLRITNATAGANTATGAAVVNFWAVR